MFYFNENHSSSTSTIPKNNSATHPMSLDLSISRDLPFLFDSSLKKLEENQRLLFFSLNIIVLILAFPLNVASMIVTAKRKNMRLLQRLLSFSLAGSDLLYLTMSSLANISALARPLRTWHLGCFMCSFLPYTQSYSLLVNSATLTIIALDRYRLIVRSLSKTWNPRSLYSYILVAAIWTLAAGITFPIMMIYVVKDVNIVETNSKNLILKIYQAEVCLSQNKTMHLIYYSVEFSVIFIPLLLSFLWFYCNVAHLLWNKRKPVSGQNTALPTVASVGVDTTTAANVTKMSCDSETKNMAQLKTTQKKKSPNMERKIRTFKIILVLMIIFLVLRLPSWIFALVKLSVELDLQCHWLMQYSFSLFAIVNSGINPILYSFLNEAIRFFKRVCKFAMSLFCCCVESEFEQIDSTRENPFIVPNDEPKSCASLNSPFAKCLQKIDKKQGKY